MTLFGQIITRLKTYFFDPMVPWDYVHVLNFVGGPMTSFAGHHLDHSHEVLRDPGHLADTILFFDMTHMLIFSGLFIFTTCSIVTGFTRGPPRDSLFLCFEYFFKSPGSCCACGKRPIRHCTVFPSPSRCIGGGG